MKKNTPTIDALAVDFCKSQVQLETLKDQKKEALDAILELDPESEKGAKMRSNIKNINESIDLLESRLVGLKGKMMSEAELITMDQVANFKTASAELAATRGRLEKELALHLAMAMKLANGCKFSEIATKIRRIFDQPGGFQLDEDTARLKSFVFTELDAIPDEYDLHQAQTDLIHLQLLKSTPVMRPSHSRSIVSAAIRRAREGAAA